MSERADEVMASCELYDEYIKTKLEEGLTIEEVKILGADSVEEADTVLDDLIEDEGWDDEITLDEWVKYVEAYKRENPIPIEIASATLGPTLSEEDFAGILDAPDSAWKSLRRYLSLDVGLSQKSLRYIEESGYRVLERLSPDTRGMKPVKGLVYGSVQSGKTVNMEALVSMAADTHWNIFIILSGTIESLRQQTKNRFRDDLRTTPAISWRHIDLSNEDAGLTTAKLRLNTFEDFSSGERYVITCLKQKARLRKLIEWLYQDKDKARRMRIVVIDDEADQASINTAPILDGEDAELYEQERKEINRLIVCLANGLLADGSKPEVTIQAINYVSYTATPYANVLNERPGESLYPKDFVHSLHAPDEYFGANVIFGNPEYIDDEGNPLAPGLDIVRIVPESDVDELRTAHEDGFGSVPDEMARALCWFLSAAALLRSQGHKKPISMLVHTSNKTVHHTADYEMVSALLRSPDKEGILEQCREVYEEEISRFTYTDLARDFSAYGLLDEVNHILPSFDEFAQEILELLSDVGNIMIGDDGSFGYSTGINICIDNCRAESMSSGDTKMRVVYPDRTTLSKLEKAPAFIVIGGNTLARGLTIEGLVCTYFTRNSSQADTLMQMGRWFGYRKGYELLQRIWLTAEVREKFRALTKIEMNLKEEIRRFEEQGLSPEKLGIKVQTMPEIKKFMLSAKNKTQMAEACDYDFTGYTYEITEFDNDSSALEHNIALAEHFLDELTKEVKPISSNSAVVWCGIDTSKIAAFLDQFVISRQSAVSHNDIMTFVNWLEKSDSAVIDRWNIAVAGKATAPSGTWPIGEGIELPRVERTKKINGTDWIDIGSLRSGSDALCDVDEASLDARQRALLREGGLNKDVGIKRAKLGLGKTPLLLIYRIDCMSTGISRTRMPLGTSCDIVSFSVIIPGDKHAGGNASAVHIRMD